ncbi:hypothetical protein Hanom_Chr05g00400131 [Helianthus anomalus]
MSYSFIFPSYILSLFFSRFRYRIVSLGERHRGSPFDSGGLPPLRKKSGFWISN